MKLNNSPSDIEILVKSQKYPWMFGILVDRYQKKFLAKGLQLLRSKEDSEDVVQETFIKIYKYAHKYEERNNINFSSWAYKILINTCYSRLGSKMKEINQVEILDFSDLDKISITEDKNYENASLVESLLSRLPAKLSRLLRLYFFEEKTYQEIADIEKISLETVKSRLHRAKKHIKKFFFQIA